ncbi:NADH-quinone oxidoreductase subunit M [Francisellaceae bacterium]|nr:NADH-quinone oxidoreductase subunit M [Francisellaceae bacterium]
MNLGSYILSLVIWVPIIGGFLVLATKGDDSKAEAARWIGLIFSLMTLVLCIPLYLGFNVNDPNMQYVENIKWIPLLNVHYALAVDGISLLFIMLTSFTTFVVILASWKTISFKVSQYMSVFLLTCGITNGVFAATDTFLFYVFWEAALIPMTLGIGIWGGKEKARAAIKFFLFTFFGSVFLLVALIYFYCRTGSWAVTEFYGVSLSDEAQWMLFTAFWIAFAVKVPMWPLHTWLPDAHTEAPAGGSVVLAALMLKLGAYGFIRFALPILPQIHQSLDWVLIALSLIAIVYVGFATIAQTDVKRLIAYSSISHMGIVTLGIFVVFMIVAKTGNPEDAALAIQGAVFQMIAHAFSSGGMFIGIGYLYTRLQSRNISDFGGVAKYMPIFAAFYMLFAMSNVGLPGTSGFVGEFMVILATFKADPWLALLAGLTLIIAPGYTLLMYKRVFFGKPNPKNENKIAALKDLSALEISVFVLLAVPTLFFGFYPEPILSLSQAASNGFVHSLI